MVRGKFISSIAIIYIHWLLGYNLQASSGPNSSINFPSLSPLYTVVLPKVKDINTESKLSLLTQKQASVATALTTGIVWRIEKHFDTQLSTVYILHQDEKESYYCSIYPSIEQLSTSLNKLVTQGSKVGAISANALSQNKLWKPQLINLKTKNISKVAVAEHPYPLTLKSALKELQNRIQAQRFKQLPNLKIVQP